MRINNNIMAMNTHRQLGTAQMGGSKSMEKLSSGFRINKAGDDAAGLSISEKMRGQIRGLNQASRNAQDGISLIQTAEGALNETHSILQRMRELAVQSANDSNTVQDRQALQQESNQLTSEITRIAKDTEFNSQKLLDGSFQNKSFQIGANQGQNLSLGMGSMDASALALTTQAESSAARVVDPSNVLGIAAVNLGGDENTGIYNVTIKSIGDSDKVDIVVTNAAGNIVAELEDFDVSAVSADGEFQKIDVTAATAGTYAFGADLEIVVSNDTIASKWAEVANGLVGASDSMQIAVVGNGVEIQTAHAEIDAIDLVSGRLAELSSTAGENYQIEFTVDGDGIVVGTVQSYNQDTSEFEDLLDANGRAFTTGVIDNNVGGVYAVSFTDPRGNEATISFAVNDGSGFSDGDVVIFDPVVSKAGSNLDISSSTKAAQFAIFQIDSALGSVSGVRSKLGAYQNRLDHTISNLGTSAENLQAAESRIRDVDMAAEMMQFTKNNILSQAATAMLAQANQAPQSVLQLLG